MSSVRLRFIDWCESFLDHAVKKAAKKLRGREGHSHPMGDVNKRLPVCIDHAGAKGKRNDPIAMSGLRYDVSKHNRMAAVSNVPELTANGNLASSAHKNFIV